MQIKYKIINRGELELKWNGKRMIIYGEVLATRTAFNVFLQSIKKWEPPHENEEITDGEKYRIIKAFSQGI